VPLRSALRIPDSRFCPFAFPLTLQGTVQPLPHFRQIIKQLSPVQAKATPKSSQTCSASGRSYTIPLQNSSSLVPLDMSRFPQAKININATFSPMLLNSMVQKFEQTMLNDVLKHINRASSLNIFRKALITETTLLLHRGHQCE
jgi:hypothetical protein